MDLSPLRPLYADAAHQGPASSDGYVSVYLDTTPETESAGQQVALRWRAIRERLAAAGADAATLEAVQDAATRREHGVRGRAVFARRGRVLLSGDLPEPPRDEIARLAPLPHVLPLLAQRPRTVPHVRVGADRAGGQVLSVPAGEQEDVRGQAWPVHKVSAGGWAEARLQRSAEETWADNARRIAAAAAEAAQRARAEFIVLGGDVRERSMVADLLPHPLREALVLVDREVAPDSPAFDQAARAEAARRIDGEGQARLAELRARMTDGSGAARAAEGLAPTLSALRDGLASDVLLADDPSSDATAWTGPGPAEVAAGREDLLRRGVSAPVLDRADAALVRAATATGAALFLLPPRGEPREQPLRDAIGALLRAPLPAS